LDEQFQRTVNSYQTDNVNPNDWQDMNYSDFVEMTRTLRNPLVNIVYSYDGVVQLGRKLKKMTAKLSKMLILPEYFRQIIEYGRTVFDECGVWKSIFVNANGTVIVPCWKFNAPENTYSILDKSIDEIWSAPQWDIARACHDCKVLGCIWTSSQPIKTLARSYMRGLPKMITEQRADLEELA